MTTIAYDGQILAADSLVSSGDKRFGLADKIIPLADGRLLAGSGNMAVLHAVAKWLNEGGETPKLIDGEKFSGIVVRQDGTAEEISETLRLWPACIPWAGGSGEGYALLAMRLGKNAREAVELACEIDLYSGGPVRFVQVVKAKSPPPRPTNWLPHSQA